jgi:DNA-binding NtrC family response regulator
VTVASPKKILLVEDEQIIRVLCRRLLGEGYDLTMVDGVTEARRMILEKNWDLLITDLRLPDGDGIDVIEALRARDARCKVIIVTGSPTPEDRLMRIKEASVSHYINKPFEVDSLLEAVRGVLEEN